jgi:hypothetical protein
MSGSTSRALGSPGATGDGFPRLLASAVIGCVLLGFVRESRKTEPYAVAQLIRSKIRSNGRSPIETASLRSQMLYPVELRAPVKKSR